MYLTFRQRYQNISEFHIGVTDTPKKDWMTQIYFFQINYIL